MRRHTRVEVILDRLLGTDNVNLIAWESGKSSIASVGKLMHVEEGLYQVDMVKFRAGPLTEISVNNRYVLVNVELTDLVHQP